MNRGHLFVISAPSGAGKTSLVNALRRSVPNIEVSVSHTTRGRRPGEEPGKSYHFIDRNAFERMIAAGAFLEHAQVFGHYYGTAGEAIDAQLENGTDVLLEIDWQGARQVRALVPGSVSIFVLPPSRLTLEERLTQRGQDNTDIIERRMREAISEMSHYREYDYLVVNDDFDEALTQIKTIVLAQRLRTEAQAARLAPLIGSLLQC